MKGKIFLLLLFVLALGSWFAATSLASAAEPKYAVYINWDGFRYDYFTLANQPPYSGTPNINALLREGVLYSQTGSGIPSITNPMQTSIVDGAWPVVHGNRYRYYDPVDNLVKGTWRENNAQTIAEVFKEAGMPVASVQQFMLLGRGAYWENPHYLYIQPGGDWKLRVEEAVKILRGEEVNSGRTSVIMPEKPRLLAIYADDLDAIGHNDATIWGVPPASTEAERMDRLVRWLIYMDDTLGKLVQALKDIGIYDETVIFLTGDHGMTPYEGYSSLPDLLQTLNGLGCKTEFLYEGDRAAADTRIVAVGVGLQVQLSFRWPITAEEYNRIVEAVKAKPYYGGHRTREELAERGADPLTGQLLIWPKPPYNFKSTFNKNYIARGQHDSQDPSSQHVFFALAGAGVRKGLTFDLQNQIITLAPTLSRLLKLPAPAQATGRVLLEALEDDAVKATGGGWIEPVAGAGADFGFNVHYQGATFAGKGELQYQDDQAGLKFHGQEIAAVRIEGNTTVVEGAGRLNGADGYRFVLRLRDMGEPGAGADKFGITITGPDVNYKIGETAIAGGNIQIQ